MSNAPVFATDEEIDAVVAMLYPEDNPIGYRAASAHARVRATVNAMRTLGWFVATPRMRTISDHADPARDAQRPTDEQLAHLAIGDLDGARAAGTQYALTESPALAASFHVGDPVTVVEGSLRGPGTVVSLFVYVEGPNARVGVKYNVLMTDGSVARELPGRKLLRRLTEHTAVPPIQVTS